VRFSSFAFEPQAPVFELEFGPPVLLRGDHSGLVCAAQLGERITSDRQRLLQVAGIMFVING
jgi:hypothetical protein